jgi:hypothetical protein
MKILTLVSLLLISLAFVVWASTGCDLNYPDNDVRRLFPESTSYKTIYLNIQQDELLRVVSLLDQRFRVIYDPLNVPYTLYEIYAGGKKAGYIHGVNHKGQLGGIQVFVALDLKGRIKAFYIQKMTGQWAGKFRDPAFCKQFIGTSLRNFDTFDPVTGKGSGRFAEIDNPAPEALPDFLNLLRALKKNLILMDVLVYAKA